MFAGNSIAHVDPSFSSKDGARYLALFVESICAPPTSSLEKETLNPFRIEHCPPITLEAFADRMSQFMHCSASCYINAAFYLYKIKQAYPAMVTHQSAHKLFLTALVVAVKFTDDEVHKQEHYARCGGIETDELNMLEAFMFKMLGYSAYVSNGEFWTMLSGLQSLFVPAPIKMDSTMYAKHHQYSSHYQYSSSDSVGTF